MTTQAHRPTPGGVGEALVERLLGGTIAAMESISVYLGLRLGLYAALDEGGAASPGQLAAWASVDERYAREWLEQQAVAGILQVNDPAVGAGERVYRLPSPHREVLLDEVSPLYGAPLTYFLGSVSKVLPHLLDAYRSGDGVAYAEYGPDLRDHVEGLNRPMFVNDLASKWLPEVPDVHQRLVAGPPARVADMACGCGWSSISLARGCPTVVVHGIDADEQSVPKARENAAEAGVATG